MAARSWSPGDERTHMQAERERERERDWYDDES